MQNKLLKASLAGVAAIAIATSGSTFALWGDFDTLTGSSAGADQLTLVVNEPNSKTFEDIRLAPGVREDFEFVVASRGGETVPAATLRMYVDSLVGTEDGCTSSNSERAVDADCADTSSSGEFDDEAHIVVSASRPTTDSDACDSTAHPRSERQGAVSLREMYAQRTNPTELLEPGTFLEPDQYMCVAIGIFMPEFATNASQGDSASFDLTFLLNQVIARRS